MLIVLIMLLASLNAYQILNAINCGGLETIRTKLVTYQKDRFYNSNSIRSIGDVQLPQSLANGEDRYLLTQQRASSPSKMSEKHDPITYLIPLDKQGHYVLFLKFFEHDFKEKGKRIFNLKIGDQIIFTIDIYAEIGFQKVLNKWVQFDLEDQIIYLNKTYPALNAYFFDSKSISISIEPIKGRATIQSLFFVLQQNQKDTQSFKENYMAHQQAKSKITKEYLSQKYRNPPKNKFKVLEGNERFEFQKQDFVYYIKKVFSFRTLISLIGVSIILFNQMALEKIKNAFSSKKGKRKQQ